MYGLPDWITLDGDNKVHVLTWFSQTALPQPIWIRRLLPNSVITFMDGPTEVNAGVLQCSDMFSQIHQKA